MFLNALPFAISLLFLPLTGLGAYYGGIWMFAAPMFAFVAIPFLDSAMKLNEAHLPRDTELGALIWHRVLTWIWVPIQIVQIFGLVWVAAHTSWLSFWEVLIMAVVVGIASGGIGITYAHELIHQQNRFERSLGRFLMCSTLYGHWCTEHVYGHHIHVATHEDPATAREGESIFRFLPRVFIESAKSAWRIQREQLNRRNASFWSRHNAFLEYGFWTLLMVGLANWIGGGVGLLVLFIQAATAILLLELVDYVEHYGLTRRKLDNGRYEPVKPHHSWNSGHQASNWLLINLQRHSDHHSRPNKRFPTLQSLPESEAPQLPLGYPWMVLLALVPPVYFRLMEPKLEAWRQQFYPDEAGHQA